MRKAFLTGVLSALGLAFQTPQAKAPMMDSISSAELKADVSFMASDLSQGRLTDTPANRWVAEWIRSRFERIGLKTVDPGGSYYQTYYLMTSTLGKENLMEVTGEGVTLQLTPGQDYYPHSFSASGQAHGPLVYTGFGMTVPDLSYDDYSGQDLSGKVVLALNGEPGDSDPASPFDGVVRSEASSPLRKTLFAQEHGAAGILFVRDVHNRPGPEDFEAAARSYWPERPPRIPRYTLAMWSDQVRIPAAEISTSLARILVRGSKRNLEEIAEAAESRTGMAAVPLPGVEVSLKTAVQRHTVPDRNVVGLLEGSDPKLKDEYVIICGHYDHNGTEGSQVYPGADDDASGVAGTLAIADAYALAARAGQRPKRSVLFAAWDTEERGLLGAWAYAESPLLPRDKIVAVLNLDMISRDEEVPVGGGPRFNGLEVQTAESNRNSVNILGTLRSPDLRVETESANSGIGLDLRFRYDNNASNLLRRSDHWPFMQYGIPAVWFLTGLHPDYHTIYDRPEKLNYQKFEKIVKLVYQESWTLAQQPGRPGMLPRKGLTREASDSK
jgi:hypothetical protein